ncbi:MAG: hypothetical protein A3A33_04765 [Candidatus Yanofskybacteria bacterium RIFCSPLOWO2_01_FULL_49_25]|uniref:Poly A polymerase head domain-containing protein n=1 Tax=Candidatus Yanofskybacteria bacterium RIFCSPLOWO2_01_FULL_49_25 TaxID=1802701 RepID=A0A1F8GS75_9BACT|nr:MAG: hypothetical protein A3A33_04765 [Candidatus Yanofskybacteria bacterium RIFCSPLOWO2_01_FULL_49_25]
MKIINKDFEQLPLFMHDPATREIFENVMAKLKKSDKIYLVGGAARNAVYYKIFKKKLPHRDYDMALIGDRNRFTGLLRSLGFSYGKIRRKNHVVLKKRLVSKPRIKVYADWVFFDIGNTKEKTIEKSLEKGANFTINGFAIPLQAVTSDDWYRHVVTLPSAFRDLKAKRLVVNEVDHPSNLYAALRFMSQGFRKPSSEDTERLLPTPTRFPKKRFARNVKKVFTYVGGEAKARALARKLGIKQNIFDWVALQEMKKKFKKNEDQD